MRLSSMVMTRREVVGGVAGIVTATGLGLGTTVARQLADDPAVAAATQYSRWEVDEQIWLLYREIHPDARAEVPFYAVQYWYENVFLPRGPQLIEPTGVEYVDWTWEVTGKTYANTAEVSFTQAFADGETVEDVIRLVEDDGSWRWFFGRDRAFVDEQIALGGEGLFPAEPTAAPDWASSLLMRDAAVLTLLPREYPGEEDATLEDFPGGEGGTDVRYTDRQGATIARLSFSELPDGMTALEAVEQRFGEAATQPQFEVYAWDISEDAGLPYATYRHGTGPVNQDFVETIIAGDGTGFRWVVSAPSEDAISALAEILVG